MDWKTVARARAILERESGYVLKDWGGRVPVALVYPNSYFVGMSNLGFQTVYRLFNAEADIVCERAFADEALLDRDGYISLESQRPLSDFPVVAFSVSYELDYFRVASVLHRSRIPLYSEDREDGDPLVLAGGPAVSANPEPLSPLVDAFVIGEAEEAIPQVVSVLRGLPLRPRDEILRELKGIPGLYVPALHHPEDPPVPRRWVRDLDAHPTHTVIFTEDTEFGDMFLIEVGRGCGRTCLFCLARRLYRPVRERSVEVILAQAKEGLRFRRAVGLVSPATSDYSRIEELAEGLLALGVRLSLSSLRADSLSPRLLEALARSGTRTVTIAPEAGTERLRRLIGKPIGDDELLQAVELVARHRLPRLKLYFMVGLPGEEDEDVNAIASLVGEIRRRFEGEVAVTLSCFVPKPHTPFQRVAMAPARLLRKRMNRLKRELGRLGVEVSAESPAWAVVQGVLSRGDRRLDPVIAQVARSEEGITLRNWKQALENAGLTEEEFTGERPRTEVLPWSVVRV